MGCGLGEGEDRQEITNIKQGWGTMTNMQGFNIRISLVLSLATW